MTWRGDAQKIAAVVARCCYVVSSNWQPSTPATSIAASVGADQLKVPPVGGGAAASDSPELIER